jgi:hypothetical protein
VGLDVLGGLQLVRGLLCVCIIIGFDIVWVLLLLIVIVLEFGFGGYLEEQEIVWVLLIGYLSWTSLCGILSLARTCHCGSGK